MTSRARARRAPRGAGRGLPARSVCLVGSLIGSCCRPTATLLKAMLCVDDGHPYTY
eukprot:COSAG02_NODE_2753_length_8093_cov_4.161746_5_plen_56_part_00